MVVLGRRGPELLEQVQAGPAVREEQGPGLRLAYKRPQEPHPGVVEGNVQLEAPAERHLGALLVVEVEGRAPLLEPGVDVSRPHGDLLVHRRVLRVEDAVRLVLDLRQRELCVHERHRVLGQLHRRGRHDNVRRHAGRRPEVPAHRLVEVVQAVEDVPPLLDLLGAEPRRRQRGGLRLVQAHGLGDVDGQGEGEVEDVLAQPHLGDVAQRQQGLHINQTGAE